MERKSWEDILVCTACKSNLRVINHEPCALECISCGLHYIVNGGFIARMMTPDCIYPTNQKVSW